MARDMSNYIKLAIPKSKLKVEAVLAAVVAVTAAAGGGTSFPADGAWFDGQDNLISEEVRVFQWNYHSDNHEGVDYEARQLVDALFASGEQAVLKERFYDSAVAFTTRAVAGYAARMLFAPGDPTPVAQPIELPTVLADDQSARHVALNS